MNNIMVEKGNYIEAHAVNFLRHCPHCGSSAFEAISPKEFLCGDCGFNFFTNAACAVAVIITDKKGRMLLTLRAREPWKGMLDLPGGFVDPGETVEDAVRREMKEELGAEVTGMKYLCSYPNKYIFSGYEVSTIDLGFICELDDVSNLGCMDDVEGLVWYDLDEIPVDEIPGASIRNIVRQAIVYLKSERKR